MDVNIRVSWVESESSDHFSIKVKHLAPSTRVLPKDSLSSPGAASLVQTSVPPSLMDSILYICRFFGFKHVLTGDKTRACHALPLEPFRPSQLLRSDLRSGPCERIRRRMHRVHIGLVGVIGDHHPAIFHLCHAFLGKAARAEQKCLDWTGQDVNMICFLLLTATLESISVQVALASRKGLKWFKSGQLDAPAGHENCGDNFTSSFREHQLYSRFDFRSADFRTTGRSLLGRISKRF